jgi:hypothetical protein
VSILLAIAALTTGVPLLMLVAHQHLRPAPASGFQPNLLGSRPQYATTDRAALVLALCSAALATVVSTLLLTWLASCYQAALPPGRFQRMPTLAWTSFLMPSVVLGILTGLLATDLALRWFLGGRYGEYELAFGGASPGRPGDRGMPLLTFVVAGLVTGFVTLHVDKYLRIEEERIVFNPFWGLGELSYSYDDVEAVIRTSHARNKGREFEHTRYFIVFVDGRQWCNEDYGLRSGADLAEDADLADFVCRRSGKNLTVVRHIEDVPRR